MPYTKIFGSLGYWFLPVRDSTDDIMLGFLL